MRDDILFLHRYIESATGDVDDFPSISDSISEKIGYSRTAYAIEPGEVRYLLLITSYIHNTFKLPALLLFR